MNKSTINEQMTVESENRNTYEQKNVKISIIPKCYVVHTEL